MAYLNRQPPSVVNQQFRNYVAAASPIARPHIRQADHIPGDIADALEAHADWLLQL